MQICIWNFTSKSTHLIFINGLSIIISGESAISINKRAFYLDLDSIKRLPRMIEFPLNSDIHEEEYLQFPRRDPSRKNYPLLFYSFAILDENVTFFQSAISYQNSLGGKKATLQYYRDSSRILPEMHYLQGSCKILRMNPRKMHYLARS